MFLKIGCLGISVSGDSCVLSDCEMKYLKKVNLLTLLPNAKHV